MLFDINARVIPDGRVVVAIDESASTPPKVIDRLHEELVDIVAGAHAAGRHVTHIGFTHEVFPDRVVEFEPGCDVAAAMSRVRAQHIAGGGNIDALLRLVIEIAETEHWRLHDLVLCTDTELNPAKSETIDRVVRLEDAGALRVHLVRPVGAGVPARDHTAENGLDRIITTRARTNLDVRLGEPGSFLEDTRA